VKNYRTKKVIFSYLLHFLLILLLSNLYSALMLAYDLW